MGAAAPSPMIQTGFWHILRLFLAATITQEQPSAFAQQSNTRRGVHGPAMGPWVLRILSSVTGFRNTALSFI